MELLSLWHTIWRHKIVMLPILTLTALAALWTVFLRPAEYQSTASLLLISPPPPPSPAEIQADPSLIGARADNPYTRNWDPSVLISIVGSGVMSDSSREAVVRAGGTPNFTVAPAGRYGFTSPVAEVVATGPTAEQAMKTATLATSSFRQELKNVQLVENVDDRFLISVRTIESPDSARLLVSDRLRGLIAVMGMGVLGLFVGVSIADAVDRARKEGWHRTTHAAEPDVSSNGDGDPVSTVEPTKKSSVVRARKAHDRRSPVPAANGNGNGAHIEPVAVVDKSISTTSTRPPSSSRSSPTTRRARDEGRRGSG